MNAGQVKMRRVPLVVAIAGGTTAYLALAIVVFALRRPEYSHLTHTISELGEFGGGDSNWVSWGVFFPVGLALSALGVMFWRGRRNALGARAAAMLAACVAAGYLLAAFFPCDPGSPLNGTPRQAIHNWGGAVEYFGGAIALVFLACASVRHRWLFASCAVVTLVVAFALSAPDLAAVRGLLQRVAEASVFGAIILAARLQTRELPQRG